MPRPSSTPRANSATPPWTARCDVWPPASRASASARATWSASNSRAGGTRSSPSWPWPPSARWRCPSRSAGAAWRPKRCCAGRRPSPSSRPSSTAATTMPPSSGPWWGPCRRCATSSPRGGPAPLLKERFSSRSCCARIRPPSYRPAPTPTAPPGSWCPPDPRRSRRWWRTPTTRSPEAGATSWPRSCPTRLRRAPCSSYRSGPRSGPTARPSPSPGTAEHWSCSITSPPKPPSPPCASTGPPTSWASPRWSA